MKIKQISKALAKNTFLAVLDEIQSNLPPDPYLKGSLFACKVAVASFFDLYPEESKEFWDQLKQHTPQIKEELLSSKEFQQSLALTFEALLRTREARKRALIKQIYLSGYISTDDRHEMNLERFYRVSQEISLEALEYLKFIAEEILPRKEKWAKEEVAKMKGNHEGSVEWWEELTMRRKPDSEIIMRWIYEEFNPNSEIVKARIPNVLQDKSLSKAQFEKEREKENQYAEISSELLSLGIFRTIVSGGGGFGGGASNAQTLTEFGHEFIKFVRTLSLTQ